MDKELRRTLADWSAHFAGLFCVAAWAPTSNQLGSSLGLRAARVSQLVGEMTAAGLITRFPEDRWTIVTGHPLYAATCDQWVNRRQAADSIALLDPRVASRASENTLELTAGAEDGDGVSAVEAVLVASWADHVAKLLPSSPAVEAPSREVAAGERELRDRYEGAAAGARYAAALLRSAARRATRDPVPTQGVVRISQAAWDAAQGALRGRTSSGVAALEEVFASTFSAGAVLSSGSGFYGDLQARAFQLAEKMASWNKMPDPGDEPGPDTEFEDLRGPLLW